MKKKSKFRDVALLLLTSMAMGMIIYLDYIVYSLVLNLSWWIAVPAITGLALLHMLISYCWFITYDEYGSSDNK